MVSMVLTRNLSSKSCFIMESQSAREHTKPPLFSENVPGIGNDFTKVWKRISGIFTSCVGTYLSKQKHGKNTKRHEISLKSMKSIDFQ